MAAYFENTLVKREKDTRLLVVGLELHVGSYIGQLFALKTKYGSYMLWWSNIGFGTVLTNEQLLEEKRTCVKFQIDISKNKGPVPVYTECWSGLP